ncbi:uncharacterized protein LOC122342356 [Puntigrus tetrazona]|uniref:uncharacterized protein LOC122342356 n=1 Tax=Puntigrus tetrazona TaxID=1606681 RepID=UPI001C8963B9|nr:uncharacterized protein LOC122342356 [Puntigrus tetrazona]
MERLLQDLGGANGRDLMGVPLLDEVRMEHIWRVQKAACQVHSGRAGTSANALNFQLYLLEGLNRWNQDRAAASVTSKPASLLTSPGNDPLCQHQQPEGVRETENLLEDVDEGVDEEDEGFGEPAASSTLAAASFIQPAASSMPGASESVALDSAGVPGMDRVDSLAEYLVELKNQSSLILTNQQVSNIVALWQNLLDYDKQRVVFAARHQSKLDTGRFRSPKKRQEFTPGVESVKRHALTTTAPLAQWPDCCRLIETIFVKLCAIHKSPKKKGVGTVSRWDLILEDYKKIRQRILTNAAVMQQTTLQLVNVSHTTLVQWHNKRVKRQDSAVLMQGLQLPSRLSVAADPLPSANVRPHLCPQAGPSHQYHLPSSTVGQARVKKRKRNIAAAEIPQIPRRLLPAPLPGAQLVMLAPLATQGLTGPPAPARAPVRKLTHE